MRKGDKPMRRPRVPDRRRRQQDRSLRGGREISEGGLLEQWPNCSGWLNVSPGRIAPNASDLTGNSGEAENTLRRSTC